MNTQIIETQAQNPLSEDEPSAFAAAYERRLAEIQAVPDEALWHINIDVHAAVTTVLGALPEILAFREDLRGLGGLDQHLVDSLEDFAQAAEEANVRLTMALMPREDITALNEEGMLLRETLRSDAVALANRGLIDPERLKPFKGHVGFKNVALELLEWAVLLQGVWPTIAGKTALTLKEVQHAKALGERLVRAAGLREQAPSVLAEVTKIRQQAVSLFLTAYDEVRRAIGFIRWGQDDAETIAPSLYAGRGSRRPGAKEGAGAEPAASPGAAGPAATETPIAAPAAPVRVGFPGAPVFVD